MNGLTNNWMSWIPSRTICRTLAPAEAVLVALIIAIADGWRLLLRKRARWGADVFVRLMERIHLCRESYLAGYRFVPGIATTRERRLAAAREEIRKRSYFHRRL